MFCFCPNGVWTCKGGGVTCKHFSSGVTGLRADSREAQLLIAPILVV